VIEMMKGGALGAATFKISADGGLTFHDNNGAGFSLGSPDINGDYSFDLDNAKADDGSNIFSSALDIDLKLSDDGSLLTKGDRVTIDLFDAEVQSAQDALINVDGITLVKSSNTVDDVFEGLTLNLKDASPNQTVKVEVTENVGDVAAVMSGFVEAYNSAMSLIHAQSKFNPEEDSEAPLLMGDSTVRRIQYSLQNFITGTRSDIGSGPLSLADLGITTDSKSGQLIFDSAKLSKALNEDPSGVRRLLSNYGESLGGSGAAFAGSTSATEAGSYAVKVTQARTRASVSGGVAQTISSSEELTIKINSDAQGTGNVRSMIVDLTIGMSAQQQVSAIQNAFDSRDLAVTASLEDGQIVVRHNDYGDDFKIEITSDQANGDSGFKTTTKSGIGTDLEGTINGVKADVSGDTLIGRDGYSSEGLRVRITNDFLGDAGQVSLSEGIGKGFADLLDSFVGFGGLLSDKIDSFDSTISRFEEQMNKVTDRATRLEDRLRQQFVNLEVTLGRLNATGDYLIAQLQSLPGVQLKK
jgi:flagellar hook-associated protein 2